MEKLTKWDIIDYLITDEDIAEYLNAAAADDDPDMFLVALGDVARAKGISALAEKTGVTRTGLYKALARGGNPSYLLVRKILAAFGVRENYVAAANPSSPGADDGTAGNLPKSRIALLRRAMAGAEADGFAAPERHLARDLKVW